MMKRISRTINNFFRCFQKLVRQSSTRPASIADSYTEEIKPFEDIPGPRGIYNLPFLGAMLMMKPFTKYTVETVHLLYNDLLDQYGPLVRVRLGEWTVLVGDIKDMATVMRSEGRHPRRMEPYINVLYCDTYGIPKGVGSLDGEEWSRYRSTLNTRMMRVDSAHHYLPIQNEVADDLVIAIKQMTSKPQDMQGLFFRYACESISVVAFNKRLGYLNSDIERDKDKLQDIKDIQTMFRLMNETLTIPRCVLRHLPLRAKTEYKTAVDRIIRRAKEHYSSNLKEIKQREEKGSIDHNNFMLSLMTLDKLTLDEMASVAFELFSSGTESTARNLQMLLYFLARNQDKQEILYQEICRIVGRNGPLTTGAVRNMKYIYACMKESFRLAYPILCGPQRYLPTDIVLKGYRIPAGTSVALMNQKTAKNGTLFADPTSYIPERWIRNENGQRSTAIPSSALLPFGFGPRQCVGRRFAEQEIYLAVTKIIQNFNIELEDGHEDVELKYRIFVGTKDPIKFLLRERS